MSEKIKIKMLGFGQDPKDCLGQFPRSEPVWGDCAFFFEQERADYDWFVVHHEFPRNKRPFEKLLCSKENTLLITTEPPSIKSYGSDYTSQFAYILTSQPEWALPHKGRIFSQPAFRWIYGAEKNKKNYDELASSEMPRKNKLISTVCSNKRQRHTLHNSRYKFTRALKKRISEMDVYGFGINPIDDKAEALDSYFYHVAVENYLGEHHWTEKLTDAFLGRSLPFYCGCPNLTEYFPEKSFIPIDIFDVESSAQTIRKALKDNEYEKRAPYIEEARNLILNKYNMFAVLSREIESRHRVFEKKDVSQHTIYSTRELRRRSPVVSLRHFFEKAVSKAAHARNFLR